MMQLVVPKASDFVLFFQEEKEPISSCTFDSTDYIGNITVTHVSSYYAKCYFSNTFKGVYFEPTKLSQFVYNTFTNITY